MSNQPSTLRTWAFCWRTLAVFTAFLIMWPAASVLLTPSVLNVHPLFAGIPSAGLAAGALVTTAEMAVEFLAVGLTLAAITLPASRLILPNPEFASGRELFALGLFDSAMVMLPIWVGISLELPAVLHHPVLFLLSHLSVIGVTALLTLVALLVPLIVAWRLGSVVLAVRGSVVVLLLTVLGWGLARFPPLKAVEGGAATHQRIVLGLDSLSYWDDLRPLRALAREHKGTFFENAVTPGLITNSVWPAILTSRRPSEIGTYFIFQAPNWSKLPEMLVDRARATNLESHSYFSDQFTLHAGSDLPFTHNHSGPRGWKQPVSVAVKDASVFLPAFLPWLPELPGRGSPPNQAGTYAFSLRRELGEILGGQRGQNGSLVLAHIGYLHQARFPGMSELTEEQRDSVRVAPVTGLVDRSFDWQYPDSEGDPIRLYNWKVHRMLVEVVAAAKESGVLEPERSNQLIIFSDHGPRTGLTDKNFGDGKHFRVPLITFGQATPDPHGTISLLDISTLIGLPDKLRETPNPPMVEYANVTGEEWAQLVKKSRPLANGGVQLDADILRAVGARVMAHDARSSRPSYSPAPSKPVIERDEHLTWLSRLLAIIMDR